MQRKGFELSAESIEKNLADIAGIRVICSFPDDIYATAKLLTQQDDITVLEVKDYIQNPKENGYILPGAGPIVCAVETLLNKTTDIIVGKPNTEMLKITLSNLNIQPDEICIVGDSYDSDIKMAQNFGAQGILITKEKRNDCQCITQLADLLEIMK